jgi:hypothetical protein
VCAVPTPLVPAGQEKGFIGIKDTPITIMPWLPFGKRGTLEVPLHRAPTDADPVCDRIEGPSLLMTGPHLLVVGPPPGAPLAGQSCRRCGRWLGGNQDGRLRWGDRNTVVLHR